MAKKHLMEGAHAVAEAAIRAGCRFYAGYPITPSTEILEYMTSRMPQVGGVAMNAESEIEGINMVWGAAAAGARAMIASSSTAISLMQEAIAEMANGQIPAVIANMSRGQADYFQATRGGGHGDYRTIVLTPSSVQEAADLTTLAFYLADKYRQPVVFMGDFLLGHTTEAVEFRELDESDLPPKGWIVDGNKAGRPIRRVTFLGDSGKTYDYGDHLERSVGRLDRIQRDEQRYDAGYLDDAELVMVAFGFPARFVKYAVKQLREEEGLRIGYIRPITLWPYPSKVVGEAAGKVKAIGVYEMNNGQMVDDVRLAVEGRCPVYSIGGISQDSSGFGVGSALNVTHIQNAIRRLYNEVVLEQVAAPASLATS
jgi:2-oxoglutarate ferredoxin oxidoreductase subunit alpha